MSPRPWRSPGTLQHLLTPAHPFCRQPGSAEPPSVGGQGQLSPSHGTPHPTLLQGCCWNPAHPTPSMLLPDLSHPEHPLCCRGVLVASALLGSRHRLSKFQPQLPPARGSPGWGSFLPPAQHPSPAAHHTIPPHEIFLGFPIPASHQLCEFCSAATAHTGCSSSGAWQEQSLFLSHQEQ